MRLPHESLKIYQKRTCCHTQGWCLITLILTEVAHVIFMIQFSPSCSQRKNNCSHSLFWRENIWTFVGTCATFSKVLRNKVKLINYLWHSCFRNKTIPVRCCTGSRHSFTLSKLFVRKREEVEMSLNCTCIHCLEIAQIAAIAAHRPFLHQLLNSDKLRGLFRLHSSIHQQRIVRAQKKKKKK